jgi:hypothetical protein
MIEMHSLIQIFKTEMHASTNSYFLSFEHNKVKPSQFPGTQNVPRKVTFRNLIIQRPEILIIQNLEEFKGKLDIEINCLVD